ERAGRVASLMLQAQVVQAAIICRAWSAIERSIALEQCHKRGGFIERQQFSIAPDAAHITRIARSSSSRPAIAQRGRISEGIEVAVDLECPAAFPTDVDPLAKAVGRAACGVNAALHGL